jgi:hypothetical protein
VGLVEEAKESSRRRRAAPEAPEAMEQRTASQTRGSPSRARPAGARSRRTNFRSRRTSSRKTEPVPSGERGSSRQSGASPVHPLLSVSGYSTFTDLATCEVESFRTARGQRLEATKTPQSE